MTKRCKISSIYSSLFFKIQQSLLYFSFMPFKWMAFFITINVKGEVKMENKLRRNCDLAYSAREGLPDEVKRLYGVMGHLPFTE